MMQSQPNDSHLVAQNKLRNPLLSVAGEGFPFDNCPNNVVLMPVAPVTSTVVQDDSVFTVDQNSYVDQIPTKISLSVSDISNPSSFLDQNLQSQQLKQAQQKHSYFTSILSSLPHISLSSITGENTKSQQNQQLNKNLDTVTSLNAIHESSQTYISGSIEIASNPLEFRSENSQQLSVGNIHANKSCSPFAQQYQKPLQPPPVIVGGASTGSYRLGNQRRLKHSHLPDQLLSSSKNSYQPLPLSIFPNQSNTSITPTIFNPNTQAIVLTNPRVDQQSAFATPILDGSFSNQSTSVQNSYRNSTVVTPTSIYSITSSNFNFSSTSDNCQLNAFATAPQIIPPRFVEPITPQNTPADVAFSGFNSFKQQQEVIHEPLNNLVIQSSEHINTKQEETRNTHSTFTTISAAKIFEKLENFIDEQSDDNISVKSELSAEVATITANIPVQKKYECIEELKKINLNTTDNYQESSKQNSQTKFDIFSETLTNPQNEANDLDYFTVPLTTNFFVNSSTNSQNVPTFYNSTFQTSQPVKDPFSFLQSSPTTCFTNFSNNTVKGSEQLNSNTQTVNVNTKNSPIKSLKTLESTENVDLTSESIWKSNYNKEELAVLSPVCEASVLSAPNFYNSTEFKNTTHFFPSTLPSIYAIGPIDDRKNCEFSVSTQKSFNAEPNPSGSATLNPVQMSVNPLTSRAHETIPPSLQNLASGLPEKQMQYRPVYHHWFYCREVEAKILWLPFSMHDSLNLEEIHNSNEIRAETKVATDGGRYDVEILRRQRTSVYWSSPISEVRRCSWFYKGPAESRYIPYDESIAARLEEEFKQACISNNWNRRIDLNNGEYIIFHSSSVQVHYLHATTPELATSWGNNSSSEDNAYLQGTTSRPRVVKRGMDEFNIDDGEPEKVDHLLFLVHGIGSVCDLKFRTVEEVVDEFRSISLQLVQSHYRNSSERGIVNRIEVLPISWHATLHSGIDQKLQVITLGSIPKLRHFTNDTLLDILFYTSPIYCETIMQTVGNELNRLYALFNDRNPDFQGNVYLGGHSLGSLIVFDLLCHQKPSLAEDTNGKFDNNEENNKIGTDSMKPLTGTVLKRKLSKQVSYVMGTAGTGQPYINYPQLAFNPSAFFALGSPIGMFVTVRGIDTLGEDFVLPTCPAFFNIFHPFDPVAYRIESLINPEAHKYRPMLIPHHKGRKRMHLELKETMARVGADLKQKLLESVKSTWNSVYQLAIFHKQDNQTLEREIEKVVEEQMSNSPTETVESTANDDAGIDLKIGKLNGGRRVDYVLQEAPFEYINEYLFILTSHVCYWQSEDTMLMILKEIYGSMGIQTDAQLPQQTLSIERVSGSSSNITSPTTYDTESTETLTTEPVSLT